MKKAANLASVILTFTILLTSAVHGQEPDTPSKIEVGIHFSSLTFSRQSQQGATIAVGEDKTEAGFGGRFTINLNNHVALEAEGNFFPHENFSDANNGGRLLQGQFGIKAGKRFGKFGIFAKARPGFASFSKVFTIVGTRTIDVNGQPVSFLVFDDRRRTYFSMDLGGVLEFYPSRRVLTRIDVGDTIIHYRNVSDLQFNPTPSLVSRTAHNLQVTAGIGFRLMSPQSQEAPTPVLGKKKRRFEVGAQFSSLGLSQVEHFSFGLIVPIFVPDFRDTITQAGFGGRFTYNITPNFALEVQSDFYPKDQRIINNGRAGGRILQGQAGIKAGKHFEKFGVFAKARPGMVSFSKTASFRLDPTFLFPIFHPERRNYFSMDLGGVLEFYPSPRIVTRFDGGDTMIRYRPNEIPITIFPTVQSFRTPAETTHNLQFSAGVGYRF